MNKETKNIPRSEDMMHQIGRVGNFIRGLCFWCLQGLPL